VPEMAASRSAHRGVGSRAVTVPQHRTAELIKNLG
jgi:hypothetical protein